MNIKDLIEAVKFQVSVKPQDEFMKEVAEGLEQLYEENNRQKAEIDKLTCDYGCYKVSATDVVEQLKAEIEALIAGQKTLQKALTEKDAEIERLQELYNGANYCIDELEYAFDKVGHSNSRVDYALEKYRNLVNEMVGEKE